MLADGCPATLPAQQQQLFATDSRKRSAGDGVTMVVGHAPNSINTSASPLKKKAKASSAPKEKPKPAAKANKKRGYRLTVRTNHAATTSAGGSAADDNLEYGEEGDDDDNVDYQLQHNTYEMEMAAESNMKQLSRSPPFNSYTRMTPNVSANVSAGHASNGMSYADNLLGRSIPGKLMLNPDNPYARPELHGSSAMSRRQKLTAKAKELVANWDKPEYRAQLAPAEIGEDEEVDAAASILTMGRGG
jgi:hypothetical protein